jgi:hypothetical protein
MDTTGAPARRESTGDIARTRTTGTRYDAAACNREGRRLPGAVRTEQRNTSPAWAEVDAVQHVDASVASTAENSRSRVHDADCGSEVRALHRRVSLNLARRALRNDPTKVENADARARLHHERHVVLDQKHPDPIALDQAAQERAHGVGFLLVETG